VRAICLVLLAVLMVTTRSDYLLLVTFLMLLEWLLEPRHRPVATLVFLGAVSTYLVIQKISGNYGYIAALNFVFDNLVVPDLVPHLRDYIRLAVHQIFQILGEDFSSALFLLAVSLLAVAWSREQGARAARRTDEFTQRALILSAGLLVYLVVRFALFPLPIPRYMMSAYVLAGILFARAVQPIPSTQPDPKPSSLA
jgi:hypothetical protein